MLFSSVPNYYFCYNFRTFQNSNMGGNFEFIVILVYTYIYIYIYIYIYMVCLSTVYTFYVDRLPSESFVCLSTFYCESYVDKGPDEGS